MHNWTIQFRRDLLCITRHYAGRFSNQIELFRPSFPYKVLVKKNSQRRRNKNSHEMSRKKSNWIVNNCLSVAGEFLPDALTLFTRRQSSFLITLSHSLPFFIQSSFRRFARNELAKIEFNCQHDSVRASRVLVASFNSFSRLVCTLHLTLKLIYNQIKQFLVIFPTKFL